jgi:hypothetical protein
MNQCLKERFSELVSFVHLQRTNVKTGVGEGLVVAFVRLSQRRLLGIKFWGQPCFAAEVIRCVVL